MTPDDTLLDELRRVLDAVDETPPDSLESARAAISWRSLDAELAELIGDSSVDGTELLVRGPVLDHRVISYSTDEVRIDVEHTDGQLIGQVSPPVTGVAELYREDPAPSAVADIDEFGTFVLSDVAAGPVSLVVRPADQPWTVRTSWTAI